MAFDGKPEMASKLSELAERCEQAVGPNYELEREIAAAVGHPSAKASGFQKQYEGVRTPNYTASIDAALTLVPSEMRDEIEITTLYQIARVGINLNHGTDGGPFYGSNECNSIPLAICAAALHARSLSPITI